MPMDKWMNTISPICICLMNLYKEHIITVFIITLGFTVYICIYFINCYCKKIYFHYKYVFLTENSNSNNLWLTYGCSIDTITYCMKLLFLVSVYCLITKLYSASLYIQLTFLFAVFSAFDYDMSRNQTFFGEIIWKSS
jgi:hypothetical protein